MHRRIPLYSCLVGVLWLGACADDERNVFDAAADFEAPQLTSFSVSTRADGTVVASWEASEPVHAVVEWGSTADALHQHSYSIGRAYETSGSVRLLAPASATEYAYAVRLTDRAGNEASQFVESTPTFTTEDVVTEPLFEFVMIDVGWGDALYLESPDGRKILVDAGHPQDGQIVREFFASRGITHLDVASMTHVHNDHIGGYYGDDFSGRPGVFNARGQGADIPATYFLDILNKTPNTTENPYADLQAEVQRLSTMTPLYLETGASSSSFEVPEALNWGAGVQVDLLAAGRKDFLYPNGAPPDLGSVQNNDSMIWRVQYGAFVLLLMGDGEFATEQFLEDHWPHEFLQATVHKLGHHGSNDANSERFLAITSPQVALVTNSVLENPGVMHPYVLERVRNLGADYYASDRAIPNRDRALPGVRGDIHIYTDGECFTVSAQRIRFE
ncbi:MAG: hypothetical protein KC591_02745 [Gemmatimonadetes bacterium]|nr:hypothetical protein [Gemmatimonadota bacterium]